MTQQLDHIEQKVRLLVETLSELRAENAALTQLNNQLRADLEESNERLEALTQRLSNTQQALARQWKDDPESSQQLRKQLDQYILEIDKCIAWLQNA